MALVRLHSMRDFFRIMYAWKKQSIMVFIGIVTLVMLFSYLYTPDYEINAKIMILPQSTEAVVMSAGRQRNNIFPVSAQDINTEIELLTSIEVMRDTVQSFVDESIEQSGKPKSLGLKVEKNSWIDRMMDKFKYYLNELLIFLKLKVRLSQFDANVALLSDAIEVEPVAMSNIILVTLTAEMPKVGTVVLNRLLDVYIAHHNRSFTKEEGVQFLNKESQSYYTKLEDAEDKVKQYQKEWNIVDIKKQIETNINLLAEFTQDLKRNELALDGVKNRIAILKADIEKNKRGFVITRDMRTIPSIVELEKSIVPLLVVRSDMLKTYNPESREIMDLNGQIESLEDEIRKEILNALKTDEMDMETLKVKRKSLIYQIDNLKNETSVLNQQEKKLTNLSREANMLESNYKLYSAKAEDARILTEQKKEDLVNVRIADKAVAPPKPTFPNRILMLIISVFVAFFGALGTPFLLEFLDHRIKSAAEVEDILSLPVISYFTEERL